MKFAIIFTFYYHIEGKRILIAEIGTDECERKAMYSQVKNKAEEDSAYLKVRVQVQVQVQV